MSWQRDFTKAEWAEIETALEEIERGDYSNCKVYDSVEELFHDLDIECNEEYN